MPDRIIIISRSDNATTVLRINILARSNNNNATRTYEIVREHLMKRHNTFYLRLTADEAKGYTTTYKSEVR